MDEYRIPVRYGEHPRPIDVKVTLTYKGRDANEPMTVESVKSDDADLLKFTADASQSTAEIAVYQVELGQPMLEDNATFYRHAFEPIRFTVKARPAEGSSRAGSDEPIIIHGAVRLDLPPSRIRWWDMRGPEPVADPDPIDVYADGDDEFQLRVTWETWLPTAPKGSPNRFTSPYWDSTSRLGYDPEVVAFSHMTGPQFKAAIFGPHEDDLPRLVARPGSGNNRELSRWSSKTALPSRRFIDAKIPMLEHIRVKAWGIESITGRRPNAIDVSANGREIQREYVNVRLRPPPIRTEVIRPQKPVPADGQPHEVELRFIDTKTGRPLKEGEITWEIDAADGGPGGTVEPDGVELMEGDGGQATLTWTPPELDYRPGAQYDQRLRIYRGRGANRLPEEPVTVWCNPALRLTVDGTKVGFAWRPPYPHPPVPDGECPAEISAHLGAKFDHLSWASSGWRSKRVAQGFEQIEIDVFDAVPELTVAGDGPDVTLKVREKTDQQGRVDVELPEVAEGWKSRTDGGDPRPNLTLTEWEEEPPSYPDRCTRRALGAMETVYTTGKSATSLNRVLTASTKADVHRSGVVTAHHLAEWSAATTCTDAKAIHGATVTTAALKGAYTVDKVQEELINKAIEAFGGALYAFLDIVLSKIKMGKALEKLPGVGPRLRDLWAAAMQRFMQAARGLLDTVSHQIRRVVLPKLGQIADTVVGDVFKWSAQLLDNILDGIADLGSESSLKTQMRDELGDMSESLDRGVAAALSAVASGSFADEASRVEKYEAQLVALEDFAKKPDLVFDLSACQYWLGKMSDALCLLTYTAIAMAVAGGLLSLTGFGAAAGGPLVAGGVGLLGLTASTGLVMAIAGAFVHSSVMVSLLGVAAKLGEEYERITREMVG